MPSIILHQQQTALLHQQKALQALLLPSIQPEAPKAAAPSQPEALQTGGPRHRFNPDTPRVLQTGSWQCSAASTAWVLRSLGFEHSQDDVVNLLLAMSPAAISPRDGLESGDGRALVALLRNFGLQAHNAWLSFDEAMAIAGQKPLAMGGATFYHWVGVRGRTDDALLLANPDASNYHGISNTLNREQFDALGRFAGVWVEI